jgi:hypothetical protein
VIRRFRLKGYRTGVTKYAYRKIGGDPVKTSPPLEANVARQIREYLEVIGLRVFRADAGVPSFGKPRRSSGVGLPDFFGILPGGRWWAVEVKRPKARPRANEAEQNAVLDHLRAHGALVIVASSVDDVRQALRK